MAVSTEQRQTSDQRPPTPKFVSWALRLWQALARPLTAVFLSILAGAIVIIITWPNKQYDPFTNVIIAYSSLFQGSVGDPVKFSDTLVKVAPLIFASLSVAIAFRVGLFNIGAAGQLAVGAMAADIVGLSFRAWPGWLLVPTMIIASILAGALWGGIVGFLKAWRGAHEVVTTIMLNWIAFWLTDYLISGPPFTAPNGINQTLDLPPQGTIPAVADVYNQTLGSFLPHLDPFYFKVDISIFFALLALVLYWFITARTTFGYEIRVIGQNPKAAQYAGISIKRNTFLAMAIAGAFAGLAGSFRLMGQDHQLAATAFSMDPAGFDAIAVALLGRTTAIGMFFSSILFGGLRSGSATMQAAGIDANLVLIIEALVLFFIAADFIPALQRFIPRWMRFGLRPSPAPALVGAAIVDLPANGNGSVQNEDGEALDELATDTPKNPLASTEVTPDEHIATQQAETAMRTDESSSENFKEER